LSTIELSTTEATRMSDERWMTFDCYGTLLDWQSGFRRILAPFAGERIDALVEAFHAVEPEVEAELPTASYKAILREGVARASRRAGLEPTAADLERLVDGWGAIEAFGDTVAALEELKRQGWRLGILTNCDDDLFAATRAALGVEIDLVVTAEEVRSYKPALGHFTRFEAASGVERRNWVHAAVSWWHDMVPARDLGLRRIWVDREDSGHDASIVTARVPDMASLARLAGELYAGAPA
jgi:2-haloacid dehalogenase